MRRLPFARGSFGAVVNFFTSFGYFDDAADDVRVVGEIGRVLAPGGAFLSDVFNASRVLSTLVSREEKTVAGERVSIRRRYDSATRRIEKEITMGTGSQARTFRERVRVYLRDELEALHGDARLKRHRPPSAISTARRSTRAGPPASSSSPCAGGAR